MTPAKPQHMSGQKDDPDDLIAELTKLMATETRPGGAVSATPKVEPVATPAPAVGTPPTIRIPGISQPIATTPPQAPSKFDFGHPPGNGAPPELHANWQDRLGGKPASSEHHAGTASSERHEPTLGGSAPTGGSTWRPAIAPDEVERDPTAGGSAFEFDFGFNRQRPAAAPKPMPTPDAIPPRTAAVVPPAPPANPRPGHDPIADLIAAELDATMGRSEPAAPAEKEAAETEDHPGAVAPQVDRPKSTPAPVPNFTSPPVPRQAVTTSTPGHLPANHTGPSRGPAAQVPPAATAPRQAPRTTPESDRFTTAPVFGLGNRPAGETTPPKTELDPMDEIENLIGEAVRVELNAPPPPLARSYEESAPSRATPTQPVVPPLGNQFAPRRTSLREPEADPGGADDAILAAAAATGVEVSRVDAPYADDRQASRSRPRKQARRERPARVERRSGGAFRQLVVPAVAGTILLALGFGLYWALGMSHHDGVAPVLAADATPAKTVPAKPADTAPHSVVMDELSGSAPAAGNETLAPRDQSLGTDATQVAAANAAAASDSAEGGLANRKVRTVTVRPDGTIVSSDDSVAGAAKLPVDRPNVPAVPGAVAATPDTTLAAPSADASVGPTAEAPPTNETPPTIETPPTAGAAPIAVASVPDTTAPTTAQVQEAAPVPLPPPPRSDFARADATPAAPSSPVNAVARNAQPIGLLGNGNSNDASPVAEAPVNPVAHVQLSSQQSEAGAQASANTLQRKFGTLFNGAKLSIIRADLGAKGVYYRVIMPTSSLADAQQLCGSIKSSGGDCVATNG